MNPWRELLGELAWLAICLLAFLASCAAFAGIIIAASYLAHVGWNAAS